MATEDEYIQNLEELAEQLKEKSLRASNLQYIAKNDELRFAIYQFLLQYPKSEDEYIKHLEELAEEVKKRAHGSSNLEYIAKSDELRFAIHQFLLEYPKGEGIVKFHR